MQNNQNPTSPPEQPQAQQPQQIHQQHQQNNQTSLNPQIQNKVQQHKQQQKINEQKYHQYDNIMQENIQYNGNNQYMDDQQNPISNYTNRIRQLQQKQQILKYTISDHQQSVKQLFMNLYNKKKRLLELITQEYNSKNFNVDIGLLEQFHQLRRTIDIQYAKIQKLKTDIQMQGLTGLKNDRDTIKLKEKKQQLQAEIQGGRRFAASQYVRDYLQRTYIHKVSYQDVKYQYEMKIKLKQCLEQQKQAYEKKKQELKKALEREGLLKKQLEEEKARLEILVLPKLNKDVNGSGK